MNGNNIPHIKSAETRYLEEREALFRGLQRLDRRGFFRVSGGATAAAIAAGVGFPFHSFLPINVAYADASGGSQGFTFAYISDSHLYARKTNERFVRQLLREQRLRQEVRPHPLEHDRLGAVDGAGEPCLAHAAHAQPLDQSPAAGDDPSAARWR